MRLNDTIPGLPAWPFIEASADGREVVVHARHVSLERWRFTKWLFRIAGVWSLWAICSHTYKTQPQTLIIMPVIVFVAYAILANGLPTVRLVTWLFFRSHTKVRFTAQSITFNGRQYAVVPGVEIVFRALRPTLLPNQQPRAQQASATSYQLEFRTVEMIYGLRPVPITSIADEERAGQFAIALQLALNLVTNQQSWASRAFAASSGRMAEELPE